MSNMLKCPNPTCPYVFDPSQVPVGVVLSCPRCGMQFTLGPPAGSPKAAPPPPPPPPPPSNLVFEDAGRTAVEERDTEQALPSRGTGGYQVYILAGIASVLMAGTALMIIFKLTRSGETVSKDTASKLRDLNIGVDTPPDGWKQDDDLRVRVGPPFVLAFKRENPEAYMAFGANEPAVKGRSPRPSEMRTDLLLAFPKLFDVSTKEEFAGLETKWLGEQIAPNHGFKFRIQSTDGLIWQGEAYTVAHKGIAYYWLSWCLEDNFEGLKSEFASFRSKFKVLEARKDWKETQSNIIDYKGDTVAYTISDAEELWKEITPGDFKADKEVEGDLDKRLRMRLTPKRDRKAQPDEAVLSVYILDGAGDPLPIARKYAEDKETARIREVNADFAPPTFTELTDAPQGDPVPKIAHASTPYVRLQSKVAESRDAARLFVASGITVGTKTVVVLCWCEASKRNVFETKFVQIASSLR